MSLFENSEERKAREQMQALTAKLIKRVSPGLFFLPWGGAKLPGDYWRKTVDTFWPVWLDGCCLQKWPTPPESEEEAAERAAEYWRVIVVTIATRKNREDGTLGALFSKQDNLENFRTSEHPLLMTYYAATGEYVEPLMGRTYIDAINRLTQRWERAKVKWHNNEWEVEGNDNAINEAWQIYNSFKARAGEHYAQWGEWFYHNLKKRYDELIAEPSEDAPREAAPRGSALPQD